MRLWTIPAAALLMALGCTRPDSDPGTRTLLYRGGPLEVQACDGPITVEGWDRPEIQVTALVRESRCGAVSWGLRHEGPRTIIDAEAPWGGGSCGFLLKVPRRLQSAAFRTSRGAISATGLEGQLRFETGGGALELGELGGSVEASTGEGPVRARNLRASLRGGTSRGEVVLVSVRGGVDFSTREGCIHASELDGEGRGIHLVTVSGALDLALGSTCGRIRAHAGLRGRVRVQRQDLRAEEEGRELVAQVPGSEQSITLEAFGGSITIR